MSKKKLSKDYGLSTMPGLALREKYLTKKGKTEKPISSKKEQPLTLKKSFNYFKNLLRKTEYNPFQTEQDVDKYLTHGSFALLTGHKKDKLSPEASENQHNNLIADLEAAGHRWQHVGGKWLGGEAEPTIMVHDISPEEASNFAKKYSQQAHIQSNKGFHKELSHHESHKPPEGGHGHIIGDHIKDNYSEITLPNGKKVRFQLNVGYPMSKSEEKPKKEPHPFKVGDRVREKRTNKMGTVTAVKTQEGRKHKMKIKHDDVGEKEYNKIGHGEKWDMWDHASYWEKHDNIQKSGWGFGLDGTWGFHPVNIDETSGRFGTNNEDPKVWPEDHADYRYHSKHAAPYKGTGITRNSRGGASVSINNRSHYIDADQIPHVINALSRGKKATVESKGFGRKAEYGPEHFEEFKKVFSHKIQKSDEYNFFDDSPEGWHPEDEAVKVTPGSGRHRQLRAYLESLPEGKAHKKDLEKLGHNLQSMGLSHHLDGQGNLHHSKVTSVIDSMPKMVYGVTHDTYGEELEPFDQQREQDKQFDKHIENFDPGDYNVYASNFENEDDYNRAYEEAWDNHADNFEYYPEDEENTNIDALEEQRHSIEPSKVFQLNYTPDHEKKMKDAGVFGTFEKMLQASQHSQHPIGDRGLGWVRYTSNDDGHHIDEIQSDFGQSFVKQGSSQIKQAMSPEGFNANGQIIRMSPEEGARHLESLKTKYPDEHFNKISQILFGGKHPNEIVHEAFLQHLRNKGEAGKQVHIWDAKSKGKISLQDRSKPEPAHMQMTYNQMLPKMGYKSGSKYGQLKTQSNPEIKGEATHSQTLAKKEIIFLPLEKSKNVREQKKKLFGASGEPKSASKESKKHLESQSKALSTLSQKRYGMPLSESKGKFLELGRINKERLKQNQPILTVDEIMQHPDYEPSEDRKLFRPKKQKANPKPDWRSGKLESQRHVGAKVHEMAHLEEMPEKLRLPEMQEEMDRGTGIAGSKYHGAGKQIEREIIPMAMENPLRRRAGIPAFGRPQHTDPRIGHSQEPLAEDSPERVSLDTGRKFGTRLKDPKTGELYDLIAQSKNMTPEMKERMEQVDAGELVFDKEKGWTPGTSIDAKINRRAREAAKKGPNNYFKTLTQKPEKLAASEDKKMKKDQLPGGKGDTKSLSSFDQKEVEMGLKVEMEHTKDKAIASEIVADHLTEDSKYYSKLKGAHLADELEKKDPLSAELTSQKGVSQSGIEARRADPRQKGIVSHGYGRVTTPEKHGQRAKNYFRQTLEKLKAQPKPNLPKSEEDMEKSTALERYLKAKGKSKWEARAKRSAGTPKGVHSPEHKNGGTSEAGSYAVGRKVPARDYDFSPDRKAGKTKAKALHQQKLSELKEMPKPNLPKSEEDMEKRCWEGYEATPGKKPYSKGSCRPVKKEEKKMSFDDIRKSIKNVSVIVAGVRLPNELHDHYHSGKIVPYDHQHREKAAKFVTDVWRKNRAEGERMSAKLLGIGPGGQALDPKAKPQ